MWVRGFECARAVRSLVCVPCFVLERGVRIPALMSWVSVSCRVSRSMFCLVVGACPLLSTCLVLLHAVHVLSAECIHVMSGAVWHAACVLHWLRAFMLSCFVWTRGLWVSSLAACLCPVLHMAGDLFCWPCACVFCFVWAHGLSCFVLCAMWPHPSCYPIIDLFAPPVPRYPPQLLPLKSPCVLSPGLVRCCMLCMPCVQPCLVQPVCFSPTG